MRICSFYCLICAMEDAILIASTGMVLALALRKRKRKERSVWVRNWLARREEKGVYNNLIQEMRLEDSESFRRYLRMNTATFERLLELVTPFVFFYYYNYYYLLVICFTRSQLQHVHLFKMRSYCIAAKNILQSN